MAGLQRVYLSDDSEDERRASEDDRRIDEYASRDRGQHSRPTTGASQTTSNRKRRNVSYQEPAAFENLDESAAPPPIENPDDQATYRRRASLEESHQPSSRPPQISQARRSSERRESIRRHRSGQQQDLTEVAAPPPVQKSLDEEQAGGFGRQRYLEEEEQAESDSGDVSPPYGQKKPGDYARREEEEVPKLLTELYTVSYLIFFAILGTLARLGTQWITWYPGTPIVTPVIWANFGGSLIMGFLSEDQGLFRQSPFPNDINGTNGEKKRRRSKISEDLDATAKAENSKRKKTIPLYIGLATGFCGSYTSFSSFARDLFLALSNQLPTPINHPYPAGDTPYTTSAVGRNGGYGFQAFLHVTISEIALSLGGLILGAQMAIFMDPITPRIHGSFVRKYVDQAMVVLGFGSWLGAIFLVIWPPDRTGGPQYDGPGSHETWRGTVLFAIVLAPVGCLLRFYASLKLNGLVPAFPLGTFAVNMFGTAIEGMCFDIQHVGVGTMGRLGGGLVGCQVLQGVLDGFCGCLTTVSTWVAEINGLKRKHGWAYAFGSVIGALCLMVVIMGSVAWSVGYTNPVVCKTGYVDKIHG